MKMTSEQLAGILDLYKKWLNKESGGKRADFTNADLTKADLHSDLHLFSLRLTNLHGADLTVANLTDAILHGFNFSFIIR